MKSILSSKNSWLILPTQGHAKLDQCFSLGALDIYESEKHVET